MKINWKVRLKNKMFWVAAIPAMLLLVQQILAIFGVSIDTSLVSEQLLDIVNTAFLLLALIGVVTVIDTIVSVTVSAFLCPFY